MSFEPLILLTPPEALPRVRTLTVTVAHRAYRIGIGPHLFRVGGLGPVRGGLMVADAANIDSRGRPGILCDEVVRECAARGFKGVVCDFRAEQAPALGQLAARLGERLSGRGLRLYVPEAYADQVPQGRVVISSALSGGSLRQRLEECLEKYGPERLVLRAERCAEDFFLPAPEGRGRKLSREELAAMLEEREPSVFFSHELCARYFTYMERESGAHFVLFDDGDTVKKKIQLARGLGVGEIMAEFAQVEDILGKVV